MRPTDHPHQEPLSEPLRRTLAWVQALARQHAADETPPLPLRELARSRGLAPRTLREHLRRLEEAGYLPRRRAGPRGLALTPLGRPVEADDTPHHGETLRRCVRLLSQAGVYPQLARELARRPWVTPELVAAWVAELGRSRAVRSLPAVLVHTLQDPARCLPPPEPAVSARTDASELTGLSERAEDAGTENEQLADERDRAEGAERTVERHDNGLAELDWEALHQALRERLPGRPDVWLRGIRPLAFGDDILVLAVPTALAADWLMLRAMPQAQEAVQAVTGRRVSIRFVPAGLR